MSASVVGRDDLEVLDLSAPVAVLVLDAHIGELDVLVLVRQSMRECPLTDLVDRPVGPAVTLPVSTVALLKETLVLTLQLVVKNDAANTTTPILYALSRVLVRSVELRIVGNLGPPGKAGVELLAVLD
jgi:hypothetical protein